LKNPKPSRIANPPENLSPEAKNWWNRIFSEYALDDSPARLLLQTALEAFDRQRECAAAIAKDGAVVTDRFGQAKPHALLAAERDARAQMMAALKALNLDLIPLHATPGRPTR
jgi:hypothetical protein